MIADNKVYDSTTAATLSGSAGVAARGSDSVSLGGINAGNHPLVQQTGLTADIAKANLSVTANDAGKAYDGTA